MEEIKTYCYFCQRRMTIVEDIFSGVDGFGLFCNNPQCVRYGLWSAISTPEGIDEEEDKESSDKEV